MQFWQKIDSAIEYRGGYRFLIFAAIIWLAIAVYGLVWIVQP